MLIFSSITLWNNKTKGMSQKDKENALAKITITGTIVTTTAIAYMVWFNFFEFKKLYQK